MLWFEWRRRSLLPRREAAMILQHNPHHFLGLLRSTPVRCGPEGRRQNVSRGCFTECPDGGVSCFHHKKQFAASPVRGLSAGVKRQVLGLYPCLRHQASLCCFGIPIPTDASLLLLRNRPRLKKYVLKQSQHQNGATLFELSSTSAMPIHPERPASKFTANDCLCTAHIVTTTLAVSTVRRARRMGFDNHVGNRHCFGRNRTRRVTDAYWPT
jgi:hypothetical protein